MSKSLFQKKRKELLMNVEGEILEIGLGTGLNLPAYPRRVKKISSVDPNPGMSVYAQRRAKSAHREIVHLTMSAEQLPFADETFDTVVCTRTMCSIPKPHEALGEIYRVLKPGGKFLFIEHGISKDTRIQKRQHRLTPRWKIVSDGCHLDRDMKKLLAHQAFELVEYKEYLLPKISLLVAQTYEGIAMKPKNLF